MEEPTQDWNKLTVAQLKVELENRGLSSVGRKQDLVGRLLDHKEESQPTVEGDEEDLITDVGETTTSDDQAVNLDEQSAEEEAALQGSGEDDEHFNGDEEMMADTGIEGEGEEEEVTETTEETAAEEAASEQTTEEGGETTEPSEEIYQKAAEGMEGLEREMAGDADEVAAETPGTAEDAPRKYIFRKLYFPPVKEFNKDMMIAHRQKSVYIYPIQPEDVNADAFKPYLEKCIIYTIRFYKQNDPNDAEQATEKKVQEEERMEVASETKAEMAEMPEVVTEAGEASETKTEDEPVEKEGEETAMEDVEVNGSRVDAVSDAEKGSTVPTDGSGEGKAEETKQDTTDVAVIHKGYLSMVFETYEEADTAVTELSKFREGVQVKCQDVGQQSVINELNSSYTVSAVREINSSENVVYIGHLPNSATEAGLKSIFKDAKEIRIIREEDHSLKGYAFAIYENAYTAEKAAKTMRSPVLDGNILAVVYFKNALNRLSANQDMMPAGMLTEMVRLNLSNRLSVLWKSKNKHAPHVQQEIKSIQQQLNTDMSIKKRAKRDQYWYTGMPPRGPMMPGGMMGSGRWPGPRPQRPMWGGRQGTSGQNTATKRPYNTSADNSPMNKRPRQQNYGMGGYGRQRMPGPRMGPGPRGPMGPRPNNTVDLLLGLTRMLGSHLQGQRPRHMRPGMQQGYMGQGRGWGGRRF